MMKKIWRVILSRPFRIAVPILLQLLLITTLIYRLSGAFFELYLFFLFLSFAIAIYVINDTGNPAFKIAWLVIILSIPMIGGIMYLIAGKKKVPKSLQSSAVAEASQTIPLFRQDPLVLTEIRNANPDIYKQVFYIQRNAHYPIYKQCETTYFGTGEDNFRCMLAELKKAEKFIFMEYFIINTGFMFNSIMDILMEKAKAGVKVKLMYDDAGCLLTLPDDFAEKMQELGIDCHAFNKLRPVLAVQMNNRDHRKICVIDGVVGFVGGLNLADEYINVKERFGHWKDSAIMLKGEAVFSLTLMFLQFFNYESAEHENYMEYSYPKIATRAVMDDGYVQPFSDSPTDEEPTGYSAHMNLINQAHSYIYITTPYLIVDYTMIQALSLSAKNGVDVRIMTPHIPDKWYVHAVTRSNYRQLTRNGVRIFEYTPGFVHAKQMVADDEAAIIGTVNMDYRSYYMHHECGVFLYNTKTVLEMKKDYLKTLSDCNEVTYQECQAVKLPVRLLESFLNLFSPLF